MERRRFVEGCLGAGRSRGGRLAGWLLHGGQRRRELSGTEGARRLLERVALIRGRAVASGA